jgi:hypothetical protein
MECARPGHSNTACDRIGEDPPSRRELHCCGRDGHTPATGRKARDLLALSSQYCVGVAAKLDNARAEDLWTMMLGSFVARHNADQADWALVPIASSTLAV